MFKCKFLIVIRGFLDLPKFRLWSESDLHKLLSRSLKKLKVRFEPTQYKNEKHTIAADFNI